MPATQSNRPISISTVLGEDVLLLRNMTATERLSAPFEYQLELLSERIDIRPDDLLGTSATAKLQLPGGEQRFYNGYVSRFSHVGWERNFALYRATLVPWLWFLSRTADCRIFQEKTVRDIVKEIFREHGFTDFEERLSGSYRQWIYCVQYRETDLSFVSRLLEHEGIYFFFEHADGKHKLVLGDSYSAHSPAAGYENVPYYPQGATKLRDLDHLDDWTLEKEVRPGAFAHTAFDFTAPRKGLLAQRSAPKAHALSELEVFDFQGDYTETADGDGYARIRLEETQADHEITRATGNARGLTCGGLFTLTGYPREDQNREYLIVAANYALETDVFESSAALQEGPVFRCSLSTIDAQVPYRPPRVTPKPFVQGPQTAIVVGKAGEEIWTDKYGRVKVQFHWDRYGKNDENSSCWVRVSHPWAGKNWGAVAIPRIGQEVIVEFLEGDPDQPIITGRVYNGDCMPPYGLPGGAVVSGVKSDTHKGSGYNEISLNDTAGSEKITIHGQYDMNTTVEHDQTTTVHNNRTDQIDVDDSETVGSNQTISIGSNQSITIGGNRTESVGGTETITIAGHRTETVNGGETVTVNGGRSHTVSGVQTTSISVAETHSVGAGRMHNVGAGEAISVGGVQAVSVGGAQTISVGGAQMVNVGALQSVNVGGPHKLSAAVISETSKGPFKIKAGAVFMVDAPTIVLKAGGSTITMNSGGVTIKGAKITVKASGSASIKAGGSIKIKGSNIGED
ncbi:MAG: type VI secretion system Vgr family protein [Bdellovibrio bacteriovorus]